MEFHSFSQLTGGLHVYSQGKPFTLPILYKHQIYYNVDKFNKMCNIYYNEKTTLYLHIMNTF